MQEPITLQDFLTSLKIIMDKAAKPPEPDEDPVFFRILRDHFGSDPTHLPTVKEAFEKADHPNLHLAVTGLLSREGWQSDLYGFVPPNEHMGVKFSTLLGEHYGHEAKEGPVEYINIPLHDDSVLTCVQAGLYLIHHGDSLLALLVRGPMGWNQSGVEVDVMAADPAASEGFLAELRTTMRAHNIYRSHVPPAARH